MAIQLDSLDRRLLSEIQRDATLSVQELAERCGSSTATCQRRLKRLKEGGAVTAEIAMLDPALSSAPLTVVIEVILDNQLARHQQAFQLRMASEPAVSQCYMVSGEIDYLLIALFRDIEDYHAFVESALAADASVRKFRSMFVMKRTKFDIAVRL